MASGHDNFDEPIDSSNFHDDGEPYDDNYNHDGHYDNVDDDIDGGEGGFDDGDGGYDQNAPHGQHDDDIDEEIDDGSPADPNHPLLSGIQAQIKAQIEEHANQIYLEAKEYKEGCKRNEEEREKIGVSLYSVQQTLAKLQEQLDICSDKYNTLSQMREDIDNQKTQELDVWKQRLAEKKNLESRLEKLRKEQDKLSEQNLLLEKHNQALVTDIAVKRRQTHKAEEAMQGIERDKKHQDLLIDRMEEETRSLQNDIALLNSQLEQQRTESAIARDTLMETTNEIEAANYEKNVLSNQWKSSLIGMQRRNEALNSIEMGIQRQQEQVITIDGEIDGKIKQINEEKEKHEKQTQEYIKLENEKAYFEKQLSDLYTQLENMQNQYNSYKRTLDKTEQEIRKEEQLTKQVRQQIELLDKKCVQMNDEAKQLEDEQINIFNDQKTFKKGTQSTVQAIQKLTNLVRDKEMEAATLENDLSRLQIDLLQKAEQNHQLNQILDDVVKQMKDLDTMIEKYQLEIKHRHEGIAKKQGQLDQLNKQYEHLNSGDKEQNLGPLEATIKNLTKSIQNLEKENEMMKKNWIRSQTEQVELLQQNEDMNEQLKEAKTRQTVLLQSKIRLIAHTNQELREIKNLEQKTNSMHLEMVKLNAMLSKNQQFQRELANTNSDLESQILDHLKTKELEAIHLENSVQETQDEKRRLMEEMTETERQIMFWSKKIDLQKEIQKTLDPTVGQDENQKMKKEIHIMEQRLAELQRNQKRMVHEMEKSIEKNAVIRTKSKAQERTGSSSTKGGLQRELTNLDRDYKQKKMQAKQVEAEINQLQVQGEETAMALEQLRQVLNNKQDEAEQLQANIGLLTIEKTKILHEKERVSKLYQRHDDLRKGKYKPSYKERELQQALDTHQEKGNRIREVLRTMASYYPELDKYCGVIETMLES